MDISFAQNELFPIKTFEGILNYASFLALYPILRRYKTKRYTSKCFKLHGDSFMHGEVSK